MSKANRKSTPAFLKKYGVLVKGNSIEPLFADGDVLVVSSTEPLQAGCIVVIWPLTGERVLIRTLARVPLWLPGEIDIERSEITPTIEVGSVDGSRETLIRLDQVKAVHAVVGVSRGRRSAA